MADHDEKQEVVNKPLAIQPASTGRVVRVLHLGQQDALDLTNRDPGVADEFEAKAHEKAIDRGDRRQRLKDDLQATAAQPGIFTDAVEAATAQNAAVTITNTKDDSLGRTEMILGNSDAAHTGRLTRSQQGLGNNARLWLLLSFIAGVVIVLVAALRR